MKNSWSDCTFPLCFTALWKTKHCRQRRVIVESDIIEERLLLKKGNLLDNIWRLMDSKYSRAIKDKLHKTNSKGEWLRPWINRHRRWCLCVQIKFPCWRHRWFALRLISLVISLLAHFIVWHALVWWHASLIQLPPITLKTFLLLLGVESRPHDS